ncbi:hypothetical protein ABZ079_18010 [Streptomyces sp. NPDC006314]|uniref:hypothetical protein n=1 Tax=Streptomyces sp. NPDC006314 TaxID=3154475 RepID=UPI0033B0272D
MAGAGRQLVVRGPGCPARALLALASAACYGLVDLSGGLLSRRLHFAVVTFLGQVGGLLSAVTAALLASAEPVRPVDAP